MALVSSVAVDDTDIQNSTGATQIWRGHSY